MQFLTRLFASAATATILAASPVQAQTDSLTHLTQQFLHYTQQTLPEKLYLHVDRPLYMSGELLWFKVYAVDGTFHKPLAMSRVAYVEVLDKNQRPVLQTKIALAKAAGHGSFTLPSSLPSGAYTVRAYTSWMKNFGPDFYYHTTVRVVNPGTSLGLKLARDSAAYDVQFFPEGGSLVQGLASKVAFKVTNRLGHSVPATGTVVNEKGNLVGEFTTHRFGMGHFMLTPAPGSSYTALVQLPNKRVVSRTLPTPLAQGYVLSLQSSGSEQLTLTVTTNDQGRPTEDILLLGHAGQRVAASGIIRLANGTGQYTLDKKALPDGVTHFTIFNARKQPLAERLYFTQPRRSLSIAVKPDKSQYAGREKVTLQVSTTTEAGAAQAANMSMTVYRLDSVSATAQPAIGGYYWLASDLRGTVEQPDYYLTHTGPEAETAADDLMLTQGWSRFTWSEVVKGRPNLPYLPEINGHLVQALVRQQGNGQPAPGISAFLASPSRLVRTFNAISDNSGLLRFETHDLYGDKTVTLQTSALKDSTYQFEILNPFSTTFRTTASRIPTPLSAADQQALLERSLATQTQRAYFGKLLTRFTPLPVDSVPFYGKANEHYRLDDYTRFKVLEEVMREYVPGVQVRMRKDRFHFMVLDNLNHVIFQDEPLVLLDGVPVVDLNRLMKMDPLKIQALDVITAPYFQGTMRYNGIVSYITYQGNLADFQFNPHVLLQEYQGLQQNREFYAPRYATPEEKQSRLADLRNLLYWKPELVTTTGGSETVEFFTSDQAGKYVVEVQGLSASGRSGSKRIFFDVKPAL
ncbi:hypothetical protein [Hymenobacter swuensis]|uniref:Macroglobulin domain-containing protein n=1 Tax=Hymenobacter swuensis DY53 TaxID=1227739 RepID=W8F4F5_9BACT|nr:hypothetical protein [Hymenobacter swuensis]AHJ97441.1 hypothetical protein Hsw_1846 [Hymenobacter swuensis DY53]